MSDEMQVALILGLSAVIGLFCAALLEGIPGF